MVRNITALVFEDEVGNTLEFELTTVGDVRVFLDNASDVDPPAQFTLNRRAIVRLVNFFQEELSA